MFFHLNNHPIEEVQTNFKPTNLPNFNKFYIVNIFIRLYENSMYGADEKAKASAIINCLDTETQTIIMGGISEYNWMYDEVKEALKNQFGSKESLTEWKIEFMDLQFLRGETIAEFSSRFSLEAQNLYFAKAASFIDTKAALLNALHPHTIKPYIETYDTYGYNYIWTN